jgi:hypothetical protein
VANKLITLDDFERELKRLSKKYRTLTQDVRELGVLLAKSASIGTDLGAGLHKIRLGTASKGGGKSGGFRVITYFVEQTTEGDIVYLVTIFDKSEKANITKKELFKIIKNQLGKS